MISLALPAAAAAPFADVSDEIGLSFEHFNGMTGEYYFPEMTGQGGALFDYDGDGDLDVYLVQGARFATGEEAAEPLFPYRGDGPPRDRLLRNDRGADGAVKLVDVTAASRIDARGYGMGVATGDIDNDGDVDLYVTNYGSNQLWRNRGDGTFEDVTAKAGADDPRWSTSAVFFDYDRDGWLDLYVANYVDFSVLQNPACYAGSSRRDYCGPSGFASLPDRLLRNRGDGSFEDVTARAGVGQPGAGLGVIAADLDADGLLDLYVANDGEPNFLWRNRGDGTFEEAALLAGVAVNSRGLAEASMGVSAGDADGDGDLDLFMTHLDGESNTLYLHEEGGLYQDRTLDRGLAAPSLPFTSFGTRFFDYDNDGWLDLLVVNGAVKVLEPLAAAGDLYPLDQRNQLFRNRGGGRFREVSGAAGEPFRIAEVSRGAAFGDLDDDGDTDVLVLNNNGRARLLRNEVGSARPWIGLRLLDGARDAYGARVEILGRTAPRLVRHVGSDGSYLSANDPRVLVGLGERGGPVEVEITWLGGKRERFSGLASGAYHTLSKGGGKPAPAAAAEKGER